MDTQFILFGQRPFNNYAHERLLSIAKSIDSMSDLEVLMYKNDFENLTKKLVNSYSLRPVDISFDDQIVDLLNKRDNSGKRIYAEYTLMVKGDSDLLHCDPFSLGYVSLILPVTVKTNVISFEIDTQEYNEDFSDEVIEYIKQDYNTIKNFITNTLLNLNNESQKFNLQLEDFIISILSKKMRSANHHTLLINRLDFK